MGRFLLILCALLQSGCSTLRYLAQAGRGQLAMLQHARPIADVIRDPRTPGEVRRALERAPEFRAFAEQMGLKPTRNYEEYVDLHRDAAVWVVSACDPLAFQSKLWTFPIVDKISYLGWFDRADADAFVNELRQEKRAPSDAPAWDVDLRPAAAYSTLGWFRDPVLSTMLRGGEQGVVEFAHTLFHESVHATFYVANQSLFNESVAEFVADQLLDRFFEAKHFPPEVAARYREQRAQSKQIVSLLSDAHDALAQVYDTDLAPADKLARKAALLTALESQLHERGVKFRTLNNAVLTQFRTYHNGNAEFERLWRESGREVGSFLAKLSPLRESAEWPAEPVTDLDAFLKKF